MTGISRRIAAGISACSIGFVAAHAYGEDTGMPADLAAKVAAIGRVIDPPKTAVLYAPLQEKEPYAGVKVLRDAK